MNFLHLINCNYYNNSYTKKVEYYLFKKYNYLVTLNVK